MADTSRTFNFDQESFTNQNIEKVLFKWTIGNFSHLDSTVGKYVTSSEFSSNEHKWCLRAYPGGQKEEGKDYVSVFIIRLKETVSNPEVKAKYKFSILSTHDEALLSHGGITTLTFDATNCSWGMLKFVSKSELLDKSKGYLIDDKLKVGVELIIIKEVENGPVVPKNFVAVGDNALTMVKCDMSDYSGFMNSKELSDVQVVNQDGKAVNAHKLVLARNSIVLATTFKHPMKETNEGRVIIDNIRSEVLEQMLRFMYSGQLEESTKTNMELLTELLAAADLYEIAQLKTTCGILLKEKLTFKTVTRLFELGEIYRCSKLKDGALQLIVQNENLVLGTKEWTEFQGENPQLTISIFNHLRKVGSKDKTGENPIANSKTKKGKK